MQVTLIAVGRRMPDWVQQGTTEYTKRLPSTWKFQVKELAQDSHDTASQRMVREADALLGAVPDKSHLVALDNRGKAWSTAELSTQLETWQGLGKPLVFCIGGPDGLHARVRERADQQWSLSELTLPHPLVRVVLTEQLYRAHSMLNNHPYHRA